MTRRARPRRPRTTRNDAADNYIYIYTPSGAGTRNVLRPIFRRTVVSRSDRTGREIGELRARGLGTFFYHDVRSDGRSATRLPITETGQKSRRGTETLFVRSDDNSMYQVPAT